MFKPMIQKPYRVPAYVCIIVIAALIYMAGVAAQAQSPAPSPNPPEPTLDYIKSVIGTLTTVAGFIALIVGIVLGLFNKNNVDRLKANVQELEDIIETKEARNKELKLQNEAKEAKDALEIQTLKKKNEALEVSNESVVGHNLQMKAILKGLRLTGKWGGHEDEIFLHRTKS
jgi:CheY-like chemotaxis protein